jgi:hypothetical protein
MGHQFNDGDICIVCGVGRHYVTEVGKYIYTKPDWTRTFVEPKCGLQEGRDDQGYKLPWQDVVIFLMVCALIYFLASMVSQWREQQRIEEYHSHITPATANDTL